MVDPSIECLQSPHISSLHRMSFADFLNSLNEAHKVWELPLGLNNFSFAQEF